MAHKHRWGLALVMIGLGALLVACGSPAPPATTPGLGATVEAAVAVALPTATPTPTPDCRPSAIMGQQRG